MTLQRLLEAIAELPNAVNADLETGSHHFNNAAADEFHRRHPLLSRQMVAVVALADAVEADADVNAPWLSAAHALCADRGIDPGHISDRLETLRAELEDEDRLLDRLSGILDAVCLALRGEPPPLRRYSWYDLAEVAQRKVSQIDALLAHCPDAECPVCAAIICPYRCELHFHHDGCPACAEHEGEPPCGTP